MKQSIVQQVVKGSFLIALIGLVSATNIVAQDIQQLPLGSTLPLGDVQMEDISGRNLSLNEVKGDNGLLVIFSCNTCPWVIKWEDRYPIVQELATVNDIGIILLNPNEDYRDKGDGIEDMILHAEKAGYNLPYVLDKNHRLLMLLALHALHMYIYLMLRIHLCMWVLLMIMQIALQM